MSDFNVRCQSQMLIHIQKDIGISKTRTEVGVCDISTDIRLPSATDSEIGICHQKRGTASVPLRISFRPRFLRAPVWQISRLSSCEVRVTGNPLSHFISVRGFKEFLMINPQLRSFLISGRRAPLWLGYFSAFSSRCKSKPCGTGESCRDAQVARQVKPRGVKDPLW